MLTKIFKGACFIQFVTKHLGSQCQSRWGIVLISTMLWVSVGYDIFLSTISLLWSLTIFSWSDIHNYNNFTSYSYTLLNLYRAYLSWLDTSLTCRSLTKLLCCAEGDVGYRCLARRVSCLVDIRSRFCHHWRVKQALHVWHSQIGASILSVASQNGGFLGEFNTLPGGI